MVTFKLIALIERLSTLERKTRSRPLTKKLLMRS